MAMTWHYYGAFIRLVRPLTVGLGGAAVSVCCRCDFTVNYNVNTVRIGLPSDSLIIFAYFVAF
jgi:hypothetical protein